LQQQPTLQQPPYQPPSLQAPPAGPPQFQHHMQAQPPALRPPAYENDQPILEEEYETEEEAEKERRRKEKALGRRRQLKVVSWGLTLLWWSIVCVLIALGSYVLLWVIMTVAGIAMIFSHSGTGGAAPSLVWGLVFLIFAMVFFHSILYLVGSILCCWIPPKSGARPFIVASVSLNGAAFGILIIVFVMMIVAVARRNDMMTAVRDRLALVLIILAVLLIPAAIVLFMLFLRAVAHYLNERATGEEVFSIMITWIFLVAAYLPLSLFAIFLGLLGEMLILAALILLVALYITWFVFWVRQWMRLLNVIGTIRTVLAYEHGV
jgi:hypothetical protein